MRTDQLSDIVTPLAEWSYDLPPKIRQTDSDRAAALSHHPLMVEHDRVENTKEWRRASDKLRSLARIRRTRDNGVEGRPVFRRLIFLSVTALGLSSMSVAGDNWDPVRAARYLDGRLEQWSTWKPAASAEGPCVSCHTGMTYLLARPALRRRLGESGQTPFETGLLGRLRASVGEKPPSYLQGVEVIFAALFLSDRDRPAPSAAETARAFDQLWALQLRDGAAAGSWEWLIVNLDPWEHAESAFFGATLAALAAGQSGAVAADRGPASENLTLLATYLRAPGPARRPLHDRLALLWAASAWRELLPAHDRESLIAEAFARQQADGGWTIASLGPWTARPNAPAVSGSSSYATGFATYVLLRGGVSPSDPRIARALAWLTAHQDKDTGAWPAVSMNKRYPTGSMESFFMQDAATAFASLALIEGKR